jgi:deazaflavin-dependent oxidoreductase (nitroreductase family)
MKSNKTNENLGNVLLLLTTTGRSSRQPLVSAVQYEEYKGEHCIIVPRSTKTDWYLNILASPWVEAKVKGKNYRVLAEPVTDSARIAVFLEYNLAKQSPSITSLVRTHGLPSKPSKAQLEALSTTLVVIFLHQEKE